MLSNRFTTGMAATLYSTLTLKRTTLPQTNIKSQVYLIAMFPILKSYKVAYEIEYVALLSSSYLECVIEEAHAVFFLSWS